MKESLLYESASALSALETFSDSVHRVVWSPVLLALLLGAGLYFTCGTGLFQFRRLRLWLSGTLGSIRNGSARKQSDAHAVTPFQSLTAALAGTLGIGNIAGVATALAAGGPGAVFWMWVCALLGMMTKYAEIVLGLLYRRRTKQGAWAGGPMYYLRDGLHAPVLAGLFCVCAILASFGMGNMTQANALALALHGSFGAERWVVGVVATLLAALVLVGGIRRIGAVTERIVPLMALLYAAGSVVILVRFAPALPAALGAIWRGAFGLPAAAGGVAGWTLAQALRMGAARGVFSNEAGLGSSVMVHAASSATEPVKQGMCGIFEVFADTLVMCTLTALAILCTGALSSGEDGVCLAMEAFRRGLGPAGALFVTVSTVFFAFSTILSWSYYGEQAAVYLFGSRSVLPYRLVYLSLVSIGCTASLALVWEWSDTFNGLMAVPNLIGVLALSPLVFRATRDYLTRHAVPGAPELARTAADFARGTSPQQQQAFAVPKPPRSGGR